MAAPLPPPTLAWGQTPGHLTPERICQPVNTSEGSHLHLWFVWGPVKAGRQEVRLGRHRGVSRSTGTL